MKYQIGDVVKLTSERPDFWSSSGAMDQYLNREVTIKTLRQDSSGELTRFTILEDNHGWMFQFEDVVELVYRPNQTKREPFNKTENGKKLVEKTLQAYEADDITTAMIKYAKEMCIEQRKICADEVSKLKKVDLTIVRTVLNANLPDELNTE